MNSSLFQAITSHAPDAIALTDGEAVLRYGELQEKVKGLAQELQHKCIQSLALYADNSMEWILVDLACQLADVRIVPIPLFFSTEQLRSLLKRCGKLDALITDRAWEAKKLLSVQGEETLTSVNMQLLHYTQPAGTELPDQTAKITFTSGSSGAPKGVCLSRKNQWLTSRAIADTLGFNNVRHLSLLPLSTLLENIAGVYAPLIRGGKIIVPPAVETGLTGSSQVDAQKVLNCISHYQPHTLILVPELLLLLVTAAELGWTPPASLAFIAVGGAKVSAELIERARRQQLPVYQGYGLSECVSVVSLNTPTHHQADSCGKALPHCQIDVVDGELVIRGNPGLGYAGEPESWHQDAIRTGDTGYIDEQGYIHINGRIKNTLVTSYGRNVNPEWPESKLLAYSSIQHAVVFGDGQPHCLALIYPRFDETSDHDIQLIINECNTLLPDYARIQHWYRLQQALSVPQGTLTENGRPRREAVYSHYKDLIESSYNNLAEVATA